MRLIRRQAHGPRGSVPDTRPPGLIWEAGPAAPWAPRAAYGRSRPSASRSRCPSGTDRSSAPASLEELLVRPARIAATSGCPTAHCRAISRSDHFAHSSSPRSSMTARRLSAFVRRRPWVAFAPAREGLSPRMPSGPSDDRRCREALHLEQHTNRLLPCEVLYDHRVLD